MIIKQTPLEPGLLSVFRIFTALRLGFLLLTTLFHLVLQQELLDFVAAQTSLNFNFLLPPQDLDPSFFTFFMNIVDVVMLGVYLWWSPFQRWLGRFFLPIGLILATIFPILTQHYSVALLDSDNVFVLAGAWQLVVILFLPLVLIGWQYGFHAVLRFSFATALLDMGLTSLAVGLSNVTGLHLLLGIITIRTILYIIVGYMIARLIADQRKQRQALTQANAQLAHYATTLEQLSTSRERNRLAREMHDTLAHTLSGVTVQLEAVDALWETDPTVAKSMLAQSLNTTRNGLVETRRALQALRASPLDDLGLALALRNLAKSLATRTGLTIDVTVPEHLEDLNPTVEQCIYRVAQEAIANVDRHAQANRMTMHLERKNQQLALTITDNGQGFFADDAKSNNRFGMKGMRERAEMSGGTISVVSRPGEGTTVRLTVPVDVEKVKPEYA